MTLEDEAGIANIIVWPKLFKRQRKEVMGARMIAVDGIVQKEQGVTHVIARRLTNLTPYLMDALSADAESPARQLPPSNLWRHPRNTRMLPKGRNFH